MLTLSCGAVIESPIANGNTFVLLWMPVMEEDNVQQVTCEQDNGICQNTLVCCSGGFMDTHSALSQDRNTECLFRAEARNSHI